MPDLPQHTSNANATSAAETISTSEREILRKLASRVAELSARPVETEKRTLWYKRNSLEATRPVIFCDPENGWHEIIRAENLECEGKLAREWEMNLRKEIFWGSEMLDDRVIEPYFNIPHVWEETDWGMHEIRIGGEHGGSFAWECPLKDYSDFGLLHFPEITVDYRATDRRLAIAQEIMGDLLTVRIKTLWWWSSGMTTILVNLRGLEQIMIDMMDRPNDLHRLMAFLRDGHIEKLDFLERNNLLSLNNDGTYVGSGGFGWTRELPEPDFDGKVRACDMWGFGESQETVGVSPAMFEEFVFPYQLPILERFGLNCYGCCEPLDKRWHVIRRIPNLRRVSVSAWANIAEMAENLQDKYIYSWKPNPSDLAMNSFDGDRIRKELRHMMEITRGCRVEIVMKDCHTIGNDQTRVTRWTQIAKEEAEAL